MKKQLLEYYHINEMNERHLKWKQFYDRNKDRKNNKLFPPWKIIKTSKDNTI